MILIVQKLAVTSFGLFYYYFPVLMKRFFGLIGLLYSFCSYPQFYNTGSEPPGVKWETIRDSGIQIIYPKGFYSEANELLNLFLDVKHPVNRSMNAHPEKISVILHNGNVLSNGFVTMAPRRMELITTPPQNLDALDWYTSLAIHEYRHVAQINRMNAGFTRIMSYIIGQTAFGLPSAEIPLWAIEGDAVVTETALSKAGRGRSAEFEMFLKALHTGKQKSVSYDKSYFGSYREYIPDRYELGYRLTAFSRLKYGEEMWGKAMAYSGRNSFIPFSFNAGLKKYYGTSKGKMYRQAFDSLKQAWETEIDQTVLTSFSPVPVRKTGDYTNYRFPFINSTGDLYFVREGMDQTENIVKHDREGKEKTVYFTGNTFNGKFSAGSDMIAWSEVQPDMRWEQISYSVVKILDTRTDKVKQITKRTRLFAPDISDDDSLMVAVEMDMNNHSFIYIRNLEDDQEFKIPAPEDEFLQHPAWFNDTLIIVTGTSKPGKSLYLVNSKTSEWKRMAGPFFYNLSQPLAWKNFILFKSDLTTIDNLYALDVSTGKIFQVTSSKYGASDPFIYHNVLYYSDYTPDGYRLVKTGTDSSGWRLFHTEEFEMAEKLAKQENLPVLSKEKMIRIPVPYHKLNHIINIHSWYPFYIDPDIYNLDPKEIKPGVTILSQNLLNTLTLSLGLRYEDKNIFFQPDIIYRGLFPVFEISAETGGHQELYKFPEGITPLDTSSLKSIISFNTYIPFNLTRGRYIRYIRPGIKAEYENAVYYQNGTRSGILRLQYYTELFRYSVSSPRDIYPKWGQFFSFWYTHSPLGNSQFGRQEYGSAMFYFPGLFASNGIRLTLSGQKEQPRFIPYLNGERYYPFNRITLPRGYSVLVDGFKAKKMAKITLDYTFPLFYPDLSIPSVIYIKRIRNSFFADAAFASDIIEFSGETTRFRSKNYRSYGMELMADFHLLRIIFPISAGVRLSLAEGTFHAEFLLNMNTAIF